MNTRPAPPTRSRATLGMFQYVTLRAVSQLGENAYPAEIARYLTERLGKQVFTAQVFAALERLEDHGLVSSADSMPIRPARGGRRRRIFRVEAPGEEAVNATTAALAQPV